MTGNGGINGVAVGAVTAGLFLVYTGIKDVDTVQGLREIVGGKVPAGRAAVPTAVFGAGASAGTTAGAVAGAVGAAASGKAGALISAARAKIGKPYVFGAVGPNSYDCSGLVVACLREIGVQTPRFVTQSFAVWARSRGFIKVGEKNIQAGDIVLKSGHMGIATSNTMMVHAPHTGSFVKEAKIYTPRYMWSGWRMPQNLSVVYGPPQYPSRG